MIPNTTALVAVYNDNDGDRFQRQIIAWDSEGYALIAPATGSGFLQRAQDVRYFQGIVEDLSGLYSGYQQVIPGGGWMTQEEGDNICSPVIAWGITHDGFAYPLTYQGDSYGQRRTEGEVFHPDDAAGHQVAALLQAKNTVRGDS